jgi:hypothetical protein
MNVSDNAVGAALASRDRPPRAQPRPLGDPELLTLVGDNVFEFEAVREAAVVAPPFSDVPVALSLAVA